MSSVQAWCESCERVVSGQEPGAACVACGSTLVEHEATAPWHFKLLVGAVALYLAFRVVQMISWLVT